MGTHTLSEDEIHSNDEDLHDYCHDDGDNDEDLLDERENVTM